MTRSPSRLPELLAPVGGWPQLHAAVESGADAIYFGLTELNARARAANFGPEELPDVMRTLHERGVLGFVTLNTLVFDDELPLAARRVEAMATAGVDAVIVQDAGAVRLIREVAPGLAVHGSTQMTVTSAEGCAWAAELGVTRVVLARELSIDEIAEVARRSPVEVEVFVHGALCVSYSGQCFSSEAWGGRSANRGQCAQACRLPYDLLLDGARHDLGELSYLLSPQDLMALDQLAPLVDAGVACLKIEGRLKGPEYVAATTAAYRHALDALAAGRAAPTSAATRRELAQIFSRGLTPGFLEGPAHQRLVAGRSPRHRGVRVGTVVAVERDSVQVALVEAVKRGDGLVFDAGRAEETEVGGRLFELSVDGHPVRAAESPAVASLGFANGTALHHVRPGDWVWRNRDEALEAEIRDRFEHGTQRRAGVSCHVLGRVGAPLEVLYRDAAGREGRAETTVVCGAATGQPLTVESLTRSLGRLGDTPFMLESVHLDAPEPLFVPVSALNDVRRRAADALLQARGRAPAAQVRNDVLPGLLAAVASHRTPVATHAEPALTLMCRTLEQAQAAVALDGVAEIYLDFLEVKGLREAVAQVAAAGKRVVAVTPRVLKPNEERIDAFFSRLGADALLVRSVGLLRTLGQTPRSERRFALYGDFSLNAANALSVQVLLEAGLDRLALTHDLNADQIVALGRSADAARLEVIVHHHLPIFHTEHCVFARFLSQGNSWRDCGRPCERHDVHLVGRDGMRHRVYADMGCRNTVFNGVAQSGAERLQDFVDAGYRTFRVELVDESADAVAPLVQRYHDLMTGRAAAAEMWRWLTRNLDQGVTEGSLAVRTAPFALKPTARGGARGGAPRAGEAR